MRSAFEGIGWRLGCRVAGLATLIVPGPHVRSASLVVRSLGDASISPHWGPVSHPRLRGDHSSVEADCFHESPMRSSNLKASVPDAQSEKRASNEPAALRSSSGDSSVHQVLHWNASNAVDRDMQVVRSTP
jgi:hypothetical protein